MPLVAGFALVGCAPADERAAPPGCPVPPSPAEALSSGDGRAPVVAGSRGADVAVAAWESATGGPVRGATATGGRWTPAADISEPGARSPTAAAGGPGAAVAWDGVAGDARVVRVARTAGGTWSAPGAVGGAAGTRPRRPSLAAAPSGALLLAWRGDPAGAVMAAVAPPGGAFGPAAPVIADGDVDEVAAAVTAGGRRTVAWIERAPDGAVVRASTDRGGVWSAPVTLSDPATTPADLRAGTGSGGHLALVWRADLGERTERVDVVLRGPDGTWGARRIVGASHRRALGLPRPPGPADIAPAVAVDGAGRVVVAWPERAGGRERVLLAEVGPSGPGTPVRLGDSEAAGAPSLAIGDDGTVAAVWEALDGARLSARIAFRPPGAMSWSGCRMLSAPGREVASPEVAWPAGGAAVALWASTNDGAVLARRVERP